MRGLVLAGRYRLERQLGKGAMGSVWRAEHLSLNAAVAVKLIDEGIASTAEGVERFRREARAAAALRSAHVVQVLDYGVEGKQPFLVMELLEGESLSASLRRSGRLDIVRTASIITQVARAMTRAHAESIIHRDLKPDNIFLIEEDGQQIAKVLDFGVAKTSSSFDGLATQTGFVLGTPCYMSPEQMEGRRQLDHRTDLWALGIIGCECVTGRRPFDAATLAELMLNICVRQVPLPSSFGVVPAGFDDWFLKAVQRDPEQRFQSAKDLAEALEALALQHTPSDRAASTRAPTSSLVDNLVPTRVSAPAASPRTVPGEAYPVVAPTVPGGPFGAMESISPHSVSKSRMAAGGGVVRTRRRVVLVVACVVVGVAASAGLARWLGGDREVRATPRGTGEMQTPSPAGVAERGPAERADPAPRVSRARATPLPRASPTERTPRADREPRPPVGEVEPRSDREPKAPASRPEATAAPPPAPVSLALRCQRDPFTGELRLADVPAVEAEVILCEQDPFTGEYRRH